ncbi:unnamed protein product [Didymodactylos carnosus]|uniref:AMP-dependent synthetase/ligase domain-containing protein n=1 Tax=Didymodactylos carnosus TaxID=1234261 RepID=A0A814DXC0_9BILA|nr:unnamed protein product [Didymodactylos carnosus]CAF1063265.1 unnamed protein product [Didymodactylos carnosus]CAF3734263.1 unnamed protein product [Didymodactylos carnosus]CAF3828610.1 unnamed protein product [Didymodactylos carnosus]
MNSPIIGQIFEYQALKRPKQACLLYSDSVHKFSQYSSLTYKQVNDITNNLAQQFSQHISQMNNTVVCLLANNSVDYLLTLYALLKLNVTVFPLSTRNSPAAIVDLVIKTKASHLFISEQYWSIVEQLKNLTLESVKLDELDITSLQQSTLSFPKFAETEDRIQMIFHSSGSTSFPKPIHFLGKNILDYYDIFTSVNSEYWKENDTVLLWGSLFHIFPFAITAVVFQAGGTLALPLSATYPPSPAALLANIQVEQLTKLVSLPILLEKLIDEMKNNKDIINWTPLMKFDFIMYGGATCPDIICQELVDNGVNLIAHYGSTDLKSDLKCCRHEMIIHLNHDIKLLNERSADLRQSNDLQAVYEDESTVTGPIIYFISTATRFHQLDRQIIDHI